MQTVCRNCVPWVICKTVMQKKKIKIVIVGHVDHGKSTLIGRLMHDTDSLPEGKIDEIKTMCDSMGKELQYGFITDSLMEERTQGITIDTTRIFFKTDKKEYIIIDAPGHVEFVKNMITGASQAEAAVLIVDAKEGIQEQTKRHAYILGMLGLEQIIVVINKMDIIKFSQKKFNNLAKDITTFLNNINIKPTLIIPISAQNGDFVVKRNNKIKWYSGPTLLEALDLFKALEENQDGPLIFAVQDIYNWDKKIIAGRVEAGILKKGDKVSILPSNKKAVIQSIEEFNKKTIITAEAGKAAGIVLKNSPSVDRGDMICSQDDLPELSDEFKAHIFWMHNEPLTKNEKIILKCSTQETVCKIKKFIRILDSSTLEEKKKKEKIKNREAADVIIKTDKPIVIKNFNKVRELGRFILERLNTCAGGVITKK